MASGSNLPVGMGLISATTQVQPSNEFVLDGRRVILIDTPSSDDTNLSNADVLRMLAEFLVTTWVLSFADQSCRLTLG
jgi:hypothetical protein